MWTGWRRWVRVDGLAQILLITTFWRLVFSFLGFLTAASFPLPPPCAGTGVTGPVLHPTGRDFQLFGVWQRWDACWYERIATFGYLSGDPSVAFFPLYPLLMRMLGTVLGVNLTLSGLIISQLATVVALLGVFRLARHDFGRPTAMRAILYLSVFPSAFFLFMPYTEALFLALAVWALYTARVGAWGWAALLGFLAGITRAQGSLLVVPLGWEALRQWRSSDPCSRRSAVAPFLPLAGFLAFLGYSNIVTGQTTFIAQRSRWGAVPLLPWTAVARSWHFLRASGDVIEVVNLAFLLLFAGLLVLGLRRLPVSYTLYSAPQLLALSTRQMAVSPLMSTSRLVLVLFPAFILLALLLQRRVSQVLWLGASALLLLFLFGAFLFGRFVG